MRLFTLFYKHFPRWSVLFLLVFSPFAFGSVQRWAYTIIEVIVLFNLFLWIVKSISTKRIELPKLPFLIPIFIFLTYICFQIIPLSPRILTSLSPETDKLYSWSQPRNYGYSDIRDKQESGNKAYGSLSIHPHGTIQETVKLITYLMIFLITIKTFASVKGINNLLWVLVTMGFCISAFAIIQKTTWNGMAFWFIRLTDGKIPFGPYINRNNFAGFIGMIIPISIGMLQSELSKNEKDIRNSIVVFRILNYFEQRCGKILVLLTMISVMGVSLFMSLSRGGIFSFLIAVIAFYILMFVKGIRHRIKLPLIFLALIILFVVAWFGHTPVWNRIESFMSPEIFSSRVPLWKNSIVILADYPIFGTGLGTFKLIFTQFQALAPNVQFLYLENEYLQLLIETGIVGAGIAASIIIVFAMYARRKFKNLGRARNIPIACGLISSCVFFLVNGVVGFDFHIPANALYFSIITGALVLVLNTIDGEKGEIVKLRFSTDRLHKSYGMIKNVLIIVLIIVTGIGVLMDWKYSNRKHYKKGMKEYRKALLFQRINYKKSLGHAEKAMVILKRATELNPTNYLYHYRIGEVGGFLTLREKVLKHYPERIYIDYEQEFKRQSNFIHTTRICIMRLGNFI